MQDMNTSDTNNPDGKEAAFAPYPPPTYKRNGGAGGDHHHGSSMQKPPHHQQRGYGYPPHYASSRPSQPIQAVVSTSFGMDEEREDGPSRHHRHHSGSMQGYHHHQEYHSRYEGRQYDARDGGSMHMHRRDDHHSVFDPPQNHRDASLHYGRELPPLPPRRGDVDSRLPPLEDRTMPPHPDDRRMPPQDDLRMVAPHEDRRMQPHEDRRMASNSDEDGLAPTDDPRMALNNDEDRRMAPNDDRGITTSTDNEARPVPPPAASQIPPSPRSDTTEQTMQLHRSNSTGGSVPPSSTSYRGQGPMKRSFWHHASSGDDYQGSIPRDFMPPKRSKVGVPSPRGREYVVTARPRQDEAYQPTDRESGPPINRPPPGWFNRAMSWEAREEYYRREPGVGRYSDPWSRGSPSYRESPSGPRWAESPRCDMPMPPRSRYSPAESSYEGSWGPRWYPSEDRGWSGPQKRDEAESKHLGHEYPERDGYGAMRRQGTFESRSSSDSHTLPPMRFVHSSNGSRGVDAPPALKSPRDDPMLSEESQPDKSSSGPIRLLALAEDRISLSETLCLVRENIEVFTATMEDVEAPAPGRKHAVVVGQVGLRCIHCRHTTRSSERVKRAVCYPSSIKRIYRTVIDMKLDHFIHCKFVPDSLKSTLAALKANNTRSTGTTMQYFIRAAATLGMVDGPSGVRLVNNAPVPAPPAASTASISTVSPEAKPAEGKIASGKNDKSADGTLAQKDSTDGMPQLDNPINRNNSILSEGTGTVSSNNMDESGPPKELFTGKIPLSVPEDKMSLSPLRCFLRDQVCAFSATEEDIAVRTPTTFSVSVGQVGIGCIHCLSQPAKMRLNRAVCFPFSIARIYQSVADIQRFHLGECKMVPPDTKAKFLELQSASSKGSKGLATRQYWVTSAKKIGLVDTPKGIRFGRDPSIPAAKAVSLDILAQVASNVTTVNRPLVLPEDKPFIAEFLYVVMEQLQPCRFTEADRNKRRLKDVGCIGVECKHCAGQVDSRKFFWSSVNAVESNFVSVHTHMMECRMIPDPLKEKLAELKRLRKEQTSALKTGSQKAFFSRVWERLHKEDNKKEGEEKEEGKEMQEETKEEEQRESPETMISPDALPTVRDEAEVKKEPESPGGMPMDTEEAGKKEIEHQSPAAISMGSPAAMSTDSTGVHMFSLESPLTPMARTEKRVEKTHAATNGEAPEVPMTPTEGKSAVKITEAYQEEKKEDKGAGTAPDSPDSAQKINMVSDKMAVVSV